VFTVFTKEGLIEEIVAAAVISLDVAVETNPD
jgi:hypothetical protein